jgi:hypothetical protein
VTTLEVLKGEESMAKNRARKTVKKVRTLAPRAVPAKQARKVKSGTGVSLSEIVITKPIDKCS